MDKVILKHRTHCKTVVYELRESICVRFQSLQADSFV